MRKTLKSYSKFMSLVLRHQPSAANLVLDDNGWSKVDDLIAGMNAKGMKIHLDIIKEVVETNEKKRFSFNEDYSLIRANQGHSLNVDVELKEATPPDKLYHGTATKNLDNIIKIGLHKRKRQHVHLSLDVRTAIKVGQRHGKPTVLEIASGEMASASIPFFLSENGVWLVDEVPPIYISVVSTEEKL